VAVGDGIVPPTQLPTGRLGFDPV